MTGLAILPVVEKELRTNFNRPIHISHTEQISKEERRAALEDDGQWGLATFRPRVLRRLQAFLEVIDGRYPAIQTTASRLLIHLTAQWPDVEPLPLYPAFRVA